jgi:hypothetical protein
MTKLIVHQFLDKASEIVKQSLERTKEMASRQLYRQGVVDIVSDALGKTCVSYSKEFTRYVLRWAEELKCGEELYVAEVKLPPKYEGEGAEITVKINSELEPIVVPEGADVAALMFARMYGKKYRLYGPFTKETIDEHLRESGKIEIL